MIKAEHVNYIYQQGMPSEKQALCDINLEIPSGSVTALIGHTGSGKSTLIQHFNALIKPTGGRILIDALDVTSNETDLKKIRQTVGLVFQYPEHQLFEETVFDDIAFGPKNMGLSAEEIKSRVHYALKTVGLSEKYLNNSPFELSGGQKRRVAIAGVLAMNPKVLILDEPAAGLDPKGRDSILNMIKTLHETSPEKTIIFVSHSMEDVAKVADNIIVMNKGKIAMTGNVAEIFSRSKELSEIGLSVPQITLVTNTLKELGYSLPPHIYTVEYGAKAILKLIGGNKNV